MEWLVLLFISLPPAAPAFASPAQGPPANTLEDSVRVLAEQVQQLNATIQELRLEVTRSREETHEIREELQKALEKLGSSSGSPAPLAAGAEAQPEERLTLLEENQQLLSDKIDEQYQTKVESASKYRMKLSGTILLNIFGTRGRVDNWYVPNLALRRGAIDTTGNFGATARQSELGFEAYGPELAGGRASAALHLDFFGGSTDSAYGLASDLVRLRTATMRLDWPRTSLVVGQDGPFFSPLSPTSIASLGYPAFSYSGNLWTWIPQARVEHRLDISESNSVSIQGGFLDPLIRESLYEDSDAAPRAGQPRQPAYATRFAWTHGDSGAPLTIGIGSYYSRQNYGARRIEDAWASTADWNVPVKNRLVLSGEFYRGRAMGGLGAGLGRSVFFSGPETDPASLLIGLNSIGGWAQLKFKATEAVEFNSAYGQDEPFGRDLRHFAPSNSSGPISRNQTGMVNVIFRPRTDLVFSLEYRRLETLRGPRERNIARHLNLALGLLF